MNILTKLYFHHLCGHKIYKLCRCQKSFPAGGTVQSSDRIIFNYGPCVHDGYQTHPVLSAAVILWNNTTCLQDAVNPMNSGGSISGCAAELNKTNNKAKFGGECDKAALFSAIISTLTVRYRPWVLASSSLNYSCRMFFEAGNESQNGFYRNQILISAVIQRPNSFGSQTVVSSCTTAQHL